MHGNARLNGWGRRLLVERHLEGKPLAHVAEQLGVSRQTASKWWRRYLADPGGVWWEDHPTVADSCPHRISSELEEHIVELRRSHKIGPGQIAATVGVSSSTVWRVLKAHGLNRLRFIDPPTGTVIRYERDHPGELVHLDTKKFGRIPNGGGRFALGVEGYRTAARQKARVGYIHVHAAIDDHTRIAHAAVFEDATATSCVEFLLETIDVFAGYGIGIDAVMTDNAKAYTGRGFTATRTDWGIDHILTRPYRPQTNGKVERFHHTLKQEWSHVRPYTSEHQRRVALTRWLHHYNTRRLHTSIGAPPITRVNKGPD